MNILIVCNHYAVCSARYATAAFERLGHTVSHVGPAMGRDIWGLTLPPEYVWTPDEDMNQYTARQQWDLVVFMDSDPKVLDWGMLYNDPEYAHIHTTRKTIIYGVDNHVRDYRRDWFDHYFLAHRNVSVMDWAWHQKAQISTSAPVQRAKPDMTHLPCAYDPTLHTPSPIPFEEREYDVCTIGVMYPQRWTLVKALREAGLSVLAGTGLVYENYVAAYHNSRIALNISANGDVAQRIFETAGMGNVVMTDNCPDFAILKPDGFWTLDDYEVADEDGKAAIVVQACKDILHEPEHAQAMIAQSQAWAEPHTWDARAAEIVRWYEQR